MLKSPMTAGALLAVAGLLVSAASSPAAPETHTVRGTPARQPSSPVVITNCQAFVSDGKATPSSAFRLLTSKSVRSVVVTYVYRDATGNVLASRDVDTRMDSGANDTKSDKSVPASNLASLDCAVKSVTYTDGTTYTYVAGLRFRFDPSDERRRETAAVLSIAEQRDWVRSRGIVRAEAMPPTPTKDLPAASFWPRSARTARVRRVSFAFDSKVNDYLRHVYRLRDAGSVCAKKPVTNPGWEQHRMTTTRHLRIERGILGLPDADEPFDARDRASINVPFVSSRT